MVKKTIVIFSFTLIISLSVSVHAQFDVKKFGAKGDGVTLNTRHIQNAIDKAFESGGGVVDVPSGTYLIGTLILKDNVEFHLQPGAMILGSPDYKDYTEIIHKLDSRTNGLYAKYFILNDSPEAEEVLIKYDGITQEFIINWNEWGWAPVTMLKEYPADKDVDFEILPAKKDSHLKIAGVFFRYQDVGKTD